VPAHVTLEIAEYRRKIAELEARLKQKGEELQLSLEKATVTRRITKPKKV
jgi:hypothetical protein